MSTQVPSPAYAACWRDDTDARVAGAISAAARRAATRTFLPLGMPHGSRVDLLQLCSRVAEACVHLAEIPLAVAAAQLWVAGEADDRGCDGIHVAPLDDLAAFALLDPLLQGGRAADDERDAARHRLEQRRGGGVNVGESYCEVGGGVHRRKLGRWHVLNGHERLEPELRCEPVELGARPAAAGAREETQLRHLSPGLRKSPQDDVEVR